MKRIYKKGLFMLVAGAITASCADYNVTDDFKVEADPTISNPYADLAPIKSYIDRTANPNLTIGATLNIEEFNKQELAHAAAMTNFDNFAFGTTLMSGKVINSKGIMNFIAMNDLLAHMDEINGEVYGSPIAANANQADEWIKLLTAPIEIVVDYVPGKSIDYTTYPVGNVDCTVDKEGSKPSASIVNYDGMNVLKVASNSHVRIIEGFEVDPNAKYTITFWAKVDQDASYNVVFSGNNIVGTATSDGKWKIATGKWTKVVIEAQAKEGCTDGYLCIQNTRNKGINIQKVEVGYYPDNHRPQTAQEKSDTINYALKAWCNGLMKINKGRIKSFDLIDEPIDKDSVLENGMYSLKHSTTTKVFWQDALGNENYAPTVAKYAREAFVEHEGNPEELKFFISETGLDDPKKLESLNYWISIWDKNGAKIDGINAKLNLVCYEDEAKMAESKATFEALLDNLAKTGKLVRISNFDVKYVDAKNLAVTAANITDEQRQRLGEFNAFAIKAYLKKIPSEKQAGICKGSLVDNTDPVGLWSEDKKTHDWVRNATYKAWCDALSGK